MASPTSIVVRATTGLLLFCHALEGLAVCFLIHEASGVTVTLCPSVILWVVNLRAVTHCTVPVSVAFWWVRRHLFLSVDTSAGRKAAVKLPASDPGASCRSSAERGQRVACGPEP